MVEFLDLLGDAGPSHEPFIFLVVRALLRRCCAICCVHLVCRTFENSLARNTVKIVCSGLSALLARARTHRHLIIGARNSAICLCPWPHRSIVNARAIVHLSAIPDQARNADRRSRVHLLFDDTARVKVRIVLNAVVKLLLATLDTG